jgi:hypothetical protein
MSYHLMFCLTAEDNGSPRNPALNPMLDAKGLPQVYSRIDEAHRVLNRLRRLAEGLVYYITAIQEPTIALNNTTISIPSSVGARL